MASAGRTRSASWLLLVGSVAAVLLVFEVALRVRGLPEDRDPRVGREAGVPLHVRLDSPELFGLNPEHPRISSQGLRNAEVTFLKPLGSTRILVLGDSVVYGPAVADDRTFVARLDALLDAAGVRAEVVNAGVPGYTPYNELQYYRSRGRHLGADVVLVVFCPNDVANPRLHWSGYAEIGEVPDAAIPNPAYDREVIAPRIERTRSPLEASYLYRDLARRIGRLSGEPRPGEPDLDAAVPTFLTGEDDLGIEVLTDERTAEWQWLARTYDQLATAVKSADASFVIAYAPLAYQLERGYPHHPEAVLARYAERRGIPFIDLLAAMRGREPGELFLLDRLGDYDVWHLTRAGHEVVAQALAQFFLAHPELP